MNALLFPGQGSQQTGMGRLLYENLPAAGKLLDQANEILGYDLKTLMETGPAERLTETQYAQPAMYVCSAMYLEAVRAAEMDFKFVAGHSLGEYSAVYAAGVFSFEDGLRLVDRRGKAMAARNGQGGMTAVLGLKEEELTAYLIPGVVIANLNTENQLVLSGSLEELVAVENHLRANRIRFIRLKVSAAFHSPQMAEAEAVMKRELERIRMNPPRAVVLSNVTGRETNDAEEIRSNLIRQTTGQVRWADTMRRLEKLGARRCYECGHGQTLRKLSGSLPYLPVPVPSL